jgi:4-hydroxy 2-oxovalerate aldolase
MITFLDCTLRDGGYYNNWDFSKDLINKYLNAIENVGVDVVELGFRSLNNKGFKGPLAFTTDNFIRTLNIPKNLKLGVMVNGSEFLGETSQKTVLEKLFKNSALESPIDLVRIACHIHEFEKVLPVVNYLKDKNYKVGLNLMQISDRKEKEIKKLVSTAKKYPIDLLYMADSMGSMDPNMTENLVKYFRNEWKGPLGIHAHDNLGLALTNTLRSISGGVTWLDSTVTGMGRGPGNVKTEELSIEIAKLRNKQLNILPLMKLIREEFKPLQTHYGWGTNPYYYLTGKYGIHPTYIQEMLNDKRYKDEDILSVIENLRLEGGKSFSYDNLDTAKHFYKRKPKGNWSPQKLFNKRDVLLIGDGLTISKHKEALEQYIVSKKPLVVALNTQSDLSDKLINLRIASHPMRLLSDYKAHLSFIHPLITPYSMLPKNIHELLRKKEILDFGLNAKENKFEFSDYHCTVPNSLVAAYALAVATSGQAKHILLAGFDGYGSGDVRNAEMSKTLDEYQKTKNSLQLFAITPTQYAVKKYSVYGF